MYAHVTFVQVDPDQLEKYLDVVRASPLPAVKGQPGFEAGLVLADPQSGNVMWSPWNGPGLEHLYLREP